MEYELWITHERMILVTWGFPHLGESAELGALSSRPEEKESQGQAHGLSNV